MPSSRDRGPRNRPVSNPTVLLGLRTIHALARASRTCKKDSRRGAHPPTHSHQNHIINILPVANKMRAGRRGPNRHGENQPQDRNLRESHYGVGRGHSQLRPPKAAGLLDTSPPPAQPRQRGRPASKRTAFRGSRGTLS